MKLLLLVLILQSLSPSKKPLQGYNFVYGRNAAPQLTSGNCNICIGAGTCPNVTGESCTIDIKKPRPIIGPAHLVALLKEHIPACQSFCGWTPAQVQSIKNVVHPVKKTPSKQATK